MGEIYQVRAEDAPRSLLIARWNFDANPVFTGEGEEVNDASLSRVGEENAGELGASVVLSAESESNEPGSIYSDAVMYAVVLDTSVSTSSSRLLIASLVRLPAIQLGAAGANGSSVLPDPPTDSCSHAPIEATACSYAAHPGARCSSQTPTRARISVA